MQKRRGKQRVVQESMSILAKPFPTPHFDKLKATIESDKLPPGDKSQVEKTIKHYEQWIADIDLVMASDTPTDQRLQKMVDLLNQYRIRMDIDLIFDSQDDWLYRQKGQIKLDNSVIEEFLPRLINVCLKSEISQLNVDIGPIKAFSAIWFDSGLLKPEIGGGLNIRSKDQDFVISRPLYLKASNTSDFCNSVDKSTNLAYAAAECKTNLDKRLLPPPRVVISAPLASSIIVTIGTQYSEQRYQQKECYRREGEDNGQQREHKHHTDKDGSYTA